MKYYSDLSFRLTFVLLGDYWKWLPFTIYASLCADVLSLNGLEGVSVSSISSLTDANCRDHSSLVYHTQKLGYVNPRTKSDGASNEAKEPVFLDDIASSMDEGPGKEDGLLGDCGILPSNCLPCLASTVPSIEKRRSLSSSPPNARKKPALKLSFKWKEENANATLCEYLHYLLNSLIFSHCVHHELSYYETSRCM